MFEVKRNGKVAVDKVVYSLLAKYETSCEVILRARNGSLHEDDEEFLCSFQNCIEKACGKTNFATLEQLYMTGRLIPVETDRDWDGDLDLSFYYEYKELGLDLDGDIL